MNPRESFHRAELPPSTNPSAANTSGKSPSFLRSASDNQSLLLNYLAPKNIYPHHKLLHQCYCKPYVSPIQPTIPHPRECIQSSAEESEWAQEPHLENDTYCHFNKIDLTLMPETYLTPRSHFYMPGYTTGLTTWTARHSSETPCPTNSFPPIPRNPLY